MVDLANVSYFERTREELEEFLIFSVMVANKPADQTRDKVALLLGKWPGLPAPPPFVVLKLFIAGGTLRENLQRIRAGQYRRIERALKGIVTLNPATCTVEDLEAVHGIGPKTARFFLLHTRPGARCAALDTHILKFLRAVGVRRVPWSTPAKGATYRRLEQEFLRIADVQKVTPALLDYTVWLHYTKSKLAPEVPMAV